MTQACCGPVLKSSTEQRGMHFAKIIAAVHFYWVTALLDEQQIFIGLIAVTHVQCCFAQQPHSRHCVTTITPTEVCSSNRCAVTQHQCSAALLRAKCILHRPVLLCKTGSQHALCHCNYTYGGLLFKQVCSDSAPMLCSTGFGKMHSTLPSAALQNRVTAGMGHCNHTYGDLLFIQVCSDPTEMHCSTGQGKLHCPLLSAALQNRLTAGPSHCNYTYRDLLFTQVCSDPTEMHCSTGQGKCNPTVQCCSAKQAGSRLVSLQKPQ